MLGASKNTVFKVIKPLYSIFKVDNYWFATYYCYYLKKLDITKSAYDLYFLFCNKFFTIIKLQTNDTLIFVTNTFVIYKKKAI